MLFLKSSSEDYSTYDDAELRELNIILDLCTKKQNLTIQWNQFEDLLQSGPIINFSRESKCLITCFLEYFGIVRTKCRYCLLLKWSYSFEQITDDKLDYTRAKMSFELIAVVLEYDEDAIMLYSGILKSCRNLVHDDRCELGAMWGDCFNKGLEVVDLSINSVLERK